jgi:ABC-type Fe3+-hydroxamate transport system substrate-binding protein
VSTRTIFATLSGVAVLLVLIACGERSEPFGPLPPDLPVTVQGAAAEPFVGETLPARVVALDAGVGATAWELGANVVGAPSDVVDPSIELIAASDGRIDIDAVRALAPDLILATPRTDPSVIAQLADDPAVPIYTAPAASVDDVVRSAQELGLVLGDPVLSREFSGDLRSSLDDATRRIAGREPVRVFVDTGFRIPPDPSSLFVDLLAHAGGLFVPEDAVIDSSVEAVELERVAPDIYLATPESRVSLARLQADEQLSGIPAVISERVFVIDDAILNVGGPDVVQTINDLIDILHPDAP